MLEERPARGAVNPRRRKSEGSKNRGAIPKRKMENDVYKSLSISASSKLFRALDFQRNFFRILVRKRVNINYMKRGRIVKGSHGGSLSPHSLRRWLTEATDDAQLVDHRQTAYDFQGVLRHLRNRAFASVAEDHRLYLQWNDLYLVKRLFTSGLVILPPDVSHKVVAFHKHLDLYVLTSGAGCSLNGSASFTLSEGANHSANGRDCYRIGEMPPSSYFFKRSVVMPFKERVLQGGTKYILIAPSHCLFKVERTKLAT